MGKILNSEGIIAELVRRVRKLETRAPIGNTSVTDGTLEMNGENSLLINGSGRVSGSLYVDGIEYVDGQLRVRGSLVVTGNADFTGPVAVQGPLDITGSTTFIGPLRLEGTSTIVGAMSIEGLLDIKGGTTITGPLMVEGDVTFTGRTVMNGETEINGDTTIAGDVDVIDQGVVTAGVLHLGPSYNGGSGGLYSTETLFLGAVGLIDLLANSSVDITTADGVNIRGGGLRLVDTFGVPKDSDEWVPLVINRSSGLVARQS